MSGRSVQPAAVALAILRAGAKRRDGCLLVTSRQGPNGYVKISADGRRGVLAHRLVVEEREERLLDPNEIVDHVCHNADLSCPGGVTCWHRRCIEPAHLEVTTLVENFARGRHTVQATRLARTHCLHGHEYTEANTIVQHGPKGSWRRCRECERERNLARR